MNRHCVRVIFAISLFAPCAFGATGNLIVYDDTDENGFDHPSAQCSSGTTFYNETLSIHSGTAAIAITKDDDNGAGWTAPSVFSTSSDYDGIRLWVNAGSSDSKTTSLAIFDKDGNPHYMHLEDAYGGSLPANTWIPFEVPFSSDLFQLAESDPPATVQTICIITHSPGTGPTNFLYLDDVTLTGADIFKNGFDG